MSSHSRTTRIWTLLLGLLKKHPQRSTCTNATDPALSRPPLLLAHLNSYTQPLVTPSGTSTATHPPARKTYLKCGHTSATRSSHLEPAPRLSEIPMSYWHTLLSGALAPLSKGSFSSLSLWRSHASSYDAPLITFKICLSLSLLGDLGSSLPRRLA